ncbi:glycosyltransferase family 9 protein [Bdellovibrio sp. HCB337]|uniref:glycosyltransferase family 9 protein n=1 Tax=Bdellovibrio sp. HCB337 TaxID=3394358 RepID=UPI0039A55172
MKKAVFIRLDKIGDLICTMPVDQIDYLKDWEITWVISKGLSFIPDHSDPKRKYIELDKSNPKEARKQLEKLLREIKPDVAVSIQAPWWVSFILWKCKVAKRIGVLSKWDSFIFLNAGVRQKRSLSVKHEADYNLDLIKQIDPENIPDVTAPILHLKADPQPAWLTHRKLEPKKYVVVHPGMAGSALNWPTQYYIELIAKLKTYDKVVLTGTAADEPWLKDIKEAYKNDPQVISLQGALNPSQLLYVLEQANTVFAPSTGVIHMAASLGTRVYGFYSPIRVQTEKRWGARGNDVHLFSPDVDCPAAHHCLGDKCPMYPCMNQITPERVLKELQ